MQPLFKISLLLIFPLLFMFNSCKGTLQVEELQQEQMLNSKSVLDEYLLSLQEDFGIPGLSVAIIKEGELVYKKNRGYANLEHEVAIKDHSVFRLYSLTKVFVAVGVFQLIEQDKISLDDTIDNYVNGLPTLWKQIQIKHLLSHSSGLPDMAGNHPYEVRELTELEAVERVFALPIRFEPGERFEYNQTNFWLIKKVIEKASQESFSDFILKHQFPDVTKEDVFFSADSREIIKNRVTPYFPFAKGYLIADLPYTNGDYLFAAHSLHLTMDAFIEWNKKFTQNELIAEKTKNRMWELFPYTNSEDEFTYSWATSHFNESRGYSFSGSMSTIYYVFPEKDLSIILLTNGFTTRYNMQEVIKQFALLNERIMNIEKN